LQKISKTQFNSNVLIFPKLIPAKRIDKSKRIAHFSAYRHKCNAGDVLLPIAIRNSVEFGLNYEYNWQHLFARNFVDDKSIDIANKSNGVIIGGGGLFLRDTNPNDNSGWQWNCSIKQLKKIKVPIVLFAVGYNRFRYQPDFEPIFKEHLNVLIEKSLFFGLRNTGSIENVKKYIDLQYHNKIRFQPCCTTIIKKLYPNFTDYSKKEDFVAINCAFDRSNLRFGEDIGNKLSAIAKMAKQVSNDFRIKFYSHMPSDEYFLPFLDAYSVKYEIVRLNTNPQTIIQEYSKPSLVIGMRGHSQMIPFGCGTPILSIVSHEKMKWFLQDINHVEWGCEINDNNFEEQLLAKSLMLLENKEQIIKNIDENQDNFLDITMKNVNEIRKEFHL
jgi:polysaccharide pyruvyl transferase WcaK-like protein